MSLLYGRKVKLTVGNGVTGIDLSQLHFQFQVERGDIQTPNSCTVRVYNISDQTLSQIKTLEFRELILEAGYGGNFGIIFKGNVKYFYSGNETAIDSYVDLVAADGDSAYNFAVINKTLASGSTTLDHITACVAAMKPYGVDFDVSTLPDGLQRKEFPRGKVMCGLARDYLRDIANSNDMTWSIQDGSLQFILNTSYAPGDAIVINGQSGLIGFPEQTINGIQFDCLLNPAIKISSAVQINNALIQQFRADLSIQGQVNTSFIPSLNGPRNADGFYKVLYTTHRGDTRGNDWTSSIICIAIDSTLKNKALIPKAGAVSPGSVVPNAP